MCQSNRTLSEDPDLKVDHLETKLQYRPVKQVN